MPQLTFDPVNSMYEFSVNVHLEDPSGPESTVLLRAGPTSASAVWSAGFSQDTNTRERRETTEREKRAFMMFGRINREAKETRAEGEP